MNTKNREVFNDRVKDYFKEKAPDFLKLLEEEARSAFFLNQKKAAREDIFRIIDFKYEKSGLNEDSFFYLDDSIGKSKAYELGLIYPQDVESSMPVSFIDVKDIKLAIDLCAAPGGKSVNILNRLADDALLISNDVSYKRASVLYSNLERLGLNDTIVTSLEPSYFLKDFKGAFDLVMLDVPCSGEGMIRKYPQIIDEYSIANIRSLAQIQKGLLEVGYQLLREGGQLMYSTCTYAFEEDEDQIATFLESHRDMELMELPYLNDASTLKGCIKLSPLNGTEGQFMALLKKKSPTPETKIRYMKTVRETTVERFIKEELDISEYCLYANKDNYYLSFKPLPLIEHNVLSYGIHLGCLKGKRFEPSHSLYRANSLRGKFKHVHELNDDEYDLYISGNEIKADEEDGYYLLTYKGLSLGHGKCSNGRLKNKYPKGLRRML